MRIPFGMGAYTLGDSATFDAQRMVNAYIEAAPPGAESEVLVRQSYGIEDWSSAGSGVVRGGGVVRGVLYAVIGTTAYSFSYGGMATALGTVPGSAIVTVSGDETNVTFLTGRVIYQWNGSTLAAVTDPDAPRTDWLANLDGYYVGSNADTGQFYVSSNRDPSAWDPLDFASAEKYPDNITTGIVDHGELILFGTESGEVWYNSGNADFPLDKIPSGHFEIGCNAVHSPAKCDNTVFFVGSDYLVYRLNGYEPLRVSTNSIETALRNAADKDFRGYSWTESGHKFYGIRSTSLTVVYDASTQTWHERASYGYDYWRPAFVVQAYGTTLVGDSESNAIGELTPDVVTEWGGVFRSLATCPPISSDNRRVRHRRFELVFETGVGDLVTTDPKVMIRWSDDRGRTWSNDHERSLGRQGKYRQRVSLHGIGQTEGRIYEYSISDPVRRTLIMATLEAAPGSY